MKIGRISNRLRDHDCAQPGAYFVTLCSFKRIPIFRRVDKAIFIPSEFGLIVQEELLKSERIREEVTLDIRVLMPNHMHAIIWIRDISSTDQRPVGAHGRAPLRRKQHSPGSFIAGFKSVATKRINIHRGTPRLAVWQRNYYDHVIRNENELVRHRKHILDNPLRWELDRYFTQD